MSICYVHRNLEDIEDSFSYLSLSKAFSLEGVVLRPSNISASKYYITKIASAKVRTTLM